MVEKKALRAKERKIMFDREMQDLFLCSKIKTTALFSQDFSPIVIVNCTALHKRPNKKLVNKNFVLNIFMMAPRTGRRGR